MGIADRDYSRDEGRGGGGFLSQLTPVVKWLLILNLAAYFVDVMVKGDGVMHGPLRRHGAFTVETAVFEGEIWRFLTFQFLHGNVLHVLFNCIGIYFFGPWLERWWGSMKFTIYYLVCGVSGAAFFTLLLMLGMFPHDGVGTPLVGASAGIYGILVGVAFIAPNLRVRLLFPPVELTMRQMAITLLSISVIMITLGYVQINFLDLGGNEGGEAGHLGGAILGFFLMRFPFLLGGRGDAIRTTRPKVTKPRPLPKLRPRSGMEKDQDDEVDRILEKISSQGFQSITQAEKDLLNKASKEKQSSR
ncbi:MAG: rhomboid family intramembrane serine protease [Verrucomicrobiaceae bacterium]|nr:MAG: rhomboid family intramembrane serine protease [Verrucomicrobiaceae bacterium]